jgi:predicted protein tyrosine phosphatase
VKLLFICSRNKWRSLTAEHIFDGINGHEVRSAGTEQGARVRVTEGHLGWSDLIFVMEKRHLARLREKFADVISDKKIICLHIPDEYEYMDEGLVELLWAKVGEYVGLTK